MPAIELRPGFFMFAIVLAALDRSGSVLPILCAMAVHELAHIVMMLACGGRVLRCALLARLPVVQAEHVSEIVSFASCGVLLLAGLVLTFIKKAGLWPLGTAVYLTVRLLMLARRADAER